MYRNGEDFSAYLDGELSSDVAYELERELEADPQARAELDMLRGVGRALHEVPEPDFETSRERVWMHLEGHLGLKPPLWRRRISVPYPAVAAAAVAVFALVGVLLWLAGPDLAGSGPIRATGAQDADARIAVGGADGDDLFEWLNSQEAAGEVSLKLPEDAPQFRIMGKPQLLKAREHRPQGSAPDR
jgi:anti-sigma factor RsiW